MAQYNILDELSPEIINLILEQLRALDIAFVLTLRLVCRRFNDFATPASYRLIHLNERILSPTAEQLYPHALEHISQHTNHVSVRSDLDLPSVGRILRLVKRLLSIRWHYVAQQDRTPRIWLPSAMLNQEQVKSNRTEIFIENLPLGGAQHDLDQSCFSATLTKHLVSLKLCNSEPPLTTRPNTLKLLVVKSRRLKTLHYRDLGIGTSFCFNSDERLPPVAHLVLCSYNWHHSADEVRRHWDFSGIQSLQMVNVPVCNFFKSVELDHLCRLHTLKVGEQSGHLHQTWGGATGFLYQAIKHHIDALQTLELTCKTALFGLDALERHARTLQVLRFQDHVGFQDDSRTCPTLDYKSVRALASALVHVHTLELDMDTTEPTEFLEAVCLFPRLHTLTLHVQTRVRPVDEAVVHPDADDEAVAEMLRLLLRRRKGGVAWRRVTINVGGWRRAMVRRVGYEWKKQNERGVFAERCFVMETDGESGYAVRDEACQKGSLGRPLADEA
ncbi:hypothetical protein CDD81_3722 [Ophiocordyceps australis]|uniref:F-box domain-containing protein n=1 Tax=Ophiocordyceps australis TaxID=1399860 RepID=A0A2C5XWM6_9HYPO|nr:hypothetical protein CDD81_3722 [Ophiocordyceps australis]